MIPVNVTHCVKTLKEMFQSLIVIGATWAQAARQNTVSRLMTSAEIRRATQPWLEYERIGRTIGNDSTAAYVRRHLQTYAFRHEWQL